MDPYNCDHINIWQFLLPTFVSFTKLILTLIVLINKALVKFLKLIK